MVLGEDGREIALARDWRDLRFDKDGAGCVVEEEEDGEGTRSVGVVLGVDESSLNTADST